MELLLGLEARLPACWGEWAFFYPRSRLPLVSGLSSLGMEEMGVSFQSLTECGLQLNRMVGRV